MTLVIANDGLCLSPLV